MTTRFHEPFLSGRELQYLTDVVASGRLGGNAEYGALVQRWLERYTASPRVFLTHSCTGALELTALLLDLQPGDEVIVPSYTFCATASAFLRAGARLVFCEIDPQFFDMDAEDVASRITDRTRAIVPVHYAGYACDLVRLTALADRDGIRIVEDAAQAVGSFFGDRHLGTIGALGCWSFHETKNVHCGLGGAAAINDPALAERAEIIWERGTNRSQMRRGIVDKYTWIELGSSFYATELQAAFLLAQLESLEKHLEHRRRLWQHYVERLAPLEDLGRLRLLLPRNPTDRHNAHVLPLVLPSAAACTSLQAGLAKRGIEAYTHFVPLHSSPMGRKLGNRPEDLPVTEHYAPRLLRLPLHGGLTRADVDRIADAMFDLLDRRPPRSLVPVSAPRPVTTRPAWPEPATAVESEAVMIACADALTLRVRG